MNKKTVILFLLLVFSLSIVAAQTANSPALSPIINNFSARNFTNQPVTRTELDLIVQAGLRAPSAGNRQPWLITVVQNLALGRRILPEMGEGNVLIIVSAQGDGVTNGAVMLDCGLAAQSMFLAAQAMGLGARQFTNAALINRSNNLKTELGIPANHSVIIVTRIGHLPPGTDAVSSASPRANPDTRVNYR